MTAIRARLAGLGGVARAHDIARTAAEARALQRAAARAEVLRLRRGVYGVPGLDLDIADAARIGGRVAGVSALRHHGLWVPPDAHRQFHVEVSDDVVARPTDVRGGRVRVHWVVGGIEPRFGIAPLEATLIRVATSVRPPFAVAVLDSALNRGRLRARDWASLAARAPRAARQVMSRVDGRSESGTESVLRVLLQDAGIPATPQPPLPLGYGERADLLVGDRLLIECDSEEHHAKPDNRKADLRRDAWLTSLGFVVLRFDYSQVFEDPEGVVDTVAAVVERGDHVSRRPGERLR